MAKKPGEIYQATHFPTPENTLISVKVLIVRVFVRLTPRGRQQFDYWTIPCYENAQPIPGAVYSKHTLTFAELLPKCFCDYFQLQTIQDCCMNEHRLAAVTPQRLSEVKRSLAVFFQSPVTRLPHLVASPFALFENNRAQPFRPKRMFTILSVFQCARPEIYVYSLKLIAEVSKMMSFKRASPQLAMN